MESLDAVRREFAETLRALAALRSEALVRAFASVPREDFVGPGPWQLLRMPGDSQRALGALAERPARGWVYEATPDADPRRLYANVLVALDASRSLNNGEPAFLARCLDRLEPAPGDRILHIGCGTGYYTAVAAEAVAPGGSVVGIEVDAALAERARRNLRPWPHVGVLPGDARRLPGGGFDAVLVNAGVTEPASEWLDALRDGGRLLLPLTVGVPAQNLGVGHMLLVVRRAAGHAARFVAPVGIFHCTGARTDAGDQRLRRAFARGGHEAVRSLRAEPHDAEPSCWLHAPRFCLSRRDA